MILLVIVLSFVYVFIRPTGHPIKHKVRAAAQISVLATGLEQFCAEFGAYPESQQRQDPITDYPGSTGENTLSGAHWLTRALVGPDLLGVDRTQRSLGGKGQPLKMADLGREKRGAPFVDVSRMEPVRDNDRRFNEGGDFVPTGRYVFVDAFDQPILYYRASPKGRPPFSQRGTTQPATTDDEPLGIYNQADNARITGSDKRGGWDFAKARQGKPAHSLGIFGSTDPAHVNDKPPGRQGYTFTSYLRDRETASDSPIRPVRADSYILISAGQDGIYGTDDDVTNFEMPGRTTRQTPRGAK